jgi:succinate-semialdehyde dehydrogenase/glutarate-semialdehyde dehydrogenase
VILGNVDSGVLAYHEEIFGPVFSTIKFKTIDEAIAIANDSKYGLGGSVWSKNINEATRIARKIDSGAVFINGLVKSDPRLPFGGIKNSGYGRELSLLGIMEFVNAKTIWVGEVVANS